MEAAYLYSIPLYEVSEERISAFHHRYSLCVSHVAHNRAVVPKHWLSTDKIYTSYDMSLMQIMTDFRFQDASYEPRQSDFQSIDTGI